MQDPGFWYALCGLFGLVGCVHLFRAARKRDYRRGMRIALAISTWFWGAAAYLWRFEDQVLGYLGAFVAFALMLGGSILGIFQRAKHEPPPKGG